MVSDEFCGEEYCFASRFALPSYTAHAKTKVKEEPLILNES
jgi:hypothetical protein